MNMGRERGVLRWDIHYSMLAQRLEKVESALTSLEAESPTAKTNLRERASQREKLVHERKELQQQIHALGPSPRAKMG